MAAVSLWTALALIAAALLLATAIHVAVRWRRAPAAFRAISGVACICFVAGMLLGVWGFHLADSRSAPRGSAPTSPSSVPAGSVSASEVGRAIVATDEKHAADPMWASAAAAVEPCNEGIMPPDSVFCRIAYLARHAMGKDLNRGPRDDSIPLSDVADICDEGDIDKSSDLCTRAYAARHAAMK
jgi:hypothetical protein